jgi:plasmid stabilization system protein ParE
MSEFVLHPEAYNDLDEIWEYIATDNLDAADRVREEKLRINSIVYEVLSPGHSRTDLTSPSLRFRLNCAKPT